VTDMIERVARAIAEKYGPPKDAYAEAMLREAARAAIEAMREPTPSAAADSLIAEMIEEIERLRAALTAALPAIHSCMADDNPIWLNVMAALSTNKEGEP